jgi:hypothetical protein
MTELHDGTLLAVWRYDSNEDRQIYYQLSRDIGQTWTAPEPLAGVYARSASETTLDDYELITDSFGIAHLFVVGQPDLVSSANATLYHIEYRQGSWTNKQSIFYSSEERPEWPTAAIGPLGDIHLTWFTRGLAEGQTTYISSTEGLRVYYSHRDPILSNRSTLAFNPTRTPQPTPTLVQVLEPTATPLPQVQPFQNAVVNTTRDMYAIQTVVGGVLAAALLCAGIIAITRFWRR